MTIFVKNKHTLQIEDFQFKCCIGKKGSALKKKEGVDEFLIERKNPLTVPPDFSSLPEPRNSMDENKIAHVSLGLFANNVSIRPLLHCTFP